MTILKAVEDPKAWTEVSEEPAKGMRLRLPRWGKNAFRFLVVADIDKRQSFEKLALKIAELSKRGGLVTLKEVPSPARDFLTNKEIHNLGSRLSNTSKQAIKAEVHKLMLEFAL